MLLLMKSSLMKMLFMCAALGLVSARKFPGTKIKHFMPVLELKVEHNNHVPERDHGLHQPFPDTVHLSFDMDGEKVELNDMQLIHNMYGKNSFYEAHYDNGVVLKRRNVLNAYQNKDSVVVLHETGTFHATFFYNGEMHYAEPVHLHSDSMHEQHFQELSNHAVHDMVVYNAHHVDTEGIFCGAQSLEGEIHKHPLHQHVRSLMQYSDTTSETSTAAVTQWNCYPGNPRRILIGFAADYGFARKMGGGTANEAATRDAITQIVATSNKYVFSRQANLALSIGSSSESSAFIIKMTAAVGPNELWNTDSTTSQTIDNKLTYFAQWRAAVKPDLYGLWHLMTENYSGGGTVGLASLSVLCMKLMTSDGAVVGSSTGVSSRFSGHTWLVVAHELGHNFGAEHSFENGQGSTGGIMDYGQPTQIQINGQFIFNTALRKTQVCEEISRAVTDKNTIRAIQYSNVEYMPASQCTSPASDPVCGDIVIEFPEECDGGQFCDPTTCKVKTGCECTSGQCCDLTNCKYKSGTSTCTYESSYGNGDVQGYCKNGECAEAICDGYTSNGEAMRYAGCEGTECKISCKTSTQACRALSGVNMNMDVGTRCGTTGTCSSSGSCIGDAGSAPTQATPSAAPTRAPTQPAAWSYGAWGSCTTSCGEGTQTRTKTCVENGVTVSNTKCTATPITTQVCTNPNCYGWKTSAFSACSPSCDGGTQTRTVECQNQAGAKFSDNYCSTGDQLYNTYNNVYIEGTADVLTTSTDTLDACKATCTASATCQSIVWAPTQKICELWTQTAADFPKWVTGATNVYVLVKQANNKPVATQACTTDPCPTEWITGAWSSCSQNCGSGVQTRSVICQKTTAANVKETVDDANCGTNKPLGSTTCNTAPCPDFYWSAGSWSACTKTCGTGSQTRAVACRDKANGDAIVDDNKCAGSPPISTQSCNTQVCPVYGWVISAFSPSCPTEASCGTGTLTQRQSREVYCQESTQSVKVGDEMCTSSKPDSTKDCLPIVCPVYEWSPPTITGECLTNGGATPGCGQKGSRERTTQCLDKSKTPSEIVADSNCKAAEKPDLPAEGCDGVCTTADNKWTIGPWSACSSSCEDGLMTREVKCVDPQGQPADKCLGDAPSSEGLCNRFKCPSWVSGPWTECQALCGAGKRLRSTSCVDAFGFVVDQTLCSGDPPATEEQCAGPVCPHWHAGEFGACSTACDPGVMTRTVECREAHDHPDPDKQGLLLSINDPKCSKDAIRPKTEVPTEASCNENNPCSNFFWIPKTAWSACDKPCGGGTQTADHVCFSKVTNAEVAAEQCAGTAPTSRPCNPNSCGTYEWSITAWGACSAECGSTAVRRRDVQCLHVYTINSKTVRDVATNPGMCTETKPDISEPCNQSNPCGLGTCSSGKCVCAAGSGSVTSPCDTPGQISNVQVKDASGTASGTVPPGNVLLFTWESQGNLDSVTILLEKTGLNPLVVAHVSNSANSYSWMVPFTYVPGEYSATVRYNSQIKSSATDKVTLADSCNYVDCGSNGVCDLGECKCNPGYTGDRCTVAPCDVKGCSVLKTIDNENIATCKVNATSGEATCDCLADGGYKGVQCRIPSKCTTEITCNNGGVPDLSALDASGCPTKCVCKPGFSGTTCDVCGIQCQNGGSRSSSGCGDCSCPTGYSGNVCHCPFAVVRGDIILPASISTTDKTYTLEHLLKQDLLAAIGGGQTQVVVTKADVDSSNKVTFSANIRSPCDLVSAMYRLPRTLYVNEVWWTDLLGNFAANDIMKKISVLDSSKNDNESILRRGLVTEGLVATSFDFTEPPGFVDNCRANDCNNRGTCVLETGVCICQVGYEGPNCENRLLCFNQDCNSHGTCNPATGTCTCTDGYSGLGCSIPPSDCAGQDCNLRGVCSGGYCICSGGWTGNSCENSPNGCVGIDCSGHGSCLPDGAKYTCDCASGWEGINCESPIDLCKGVECGVFSAPCKDGKCVCTNGYYGDRCTIKPETCYDKEKNQDEDGVDCGGVCTGIKPPCPTCTDGIQNGGETGTDCGGLKCLPCDNCGDGKQNGQETGVDCGGSCCACGAPPTCSDNCKNGKEEFTDCGGPDCPACPIWETGAWTPCSKSCGGGSQSRTAVCKQAGNIVDNDQCSFRHPVSLQQTCNEDDCERFEYVDGPYSDCNKQCGGGTKKKSVTCKSQLTTYLDISKCQDNIGEPPDTTIVCNTQPCTEDYNYVTAFFGDCTKLCGGGEQRREILCQHKNQTFVDLSFCTGTRPASTQACNTEACVEVEWVTCGWDKCTAECGGGANGGIGGGSMMGVRSRLVLCKTKEETPRVVEDARCTATGAKPRDTDVGCNEQYCTDWNWMTTKWTKCVSSNGGNVGKRTRSYHCHSPDGGNARLEDCAANIPAERTPVKEEWCKVDECPVEPKPDDSPTLSGASALSGISFALFALLFSQQFFLH